MPLKAIRFESSKTPESQVVFSNHSDEPSDIENMVLANAAWALNLPSTAKINWKPADEDLLDPERYDQSDGWVGSVTIPMPGVKEIGGTWRYNVYILNIENIELVVIYGNFINIETQSFVEDTDG